jgi:hypothetical protein
MFQSPLISSEVITVRFVVCLFPFAANMTAKVFPAARRSGALWGNAG